MDYSLKTVKELRSIAIERGMTGYTLMRKADLIEAMRFNDVCKEFKITDQTVDKGSTYSGKGKPAFLRILETLLQEQDLSVRTLFDEHLRPLLNA